VKLEYTFYVSEHHSFFGRGEGAPSLIALRLHYVLWFLTVSVGCQMLQKCLDNQQPVIEKLNRKVKIAMERSGQTKSPMLSKLCELNETYKQVCCLAQQRRNELLDKMQQVSCIK